MEATTYLGLTGFADQDSQGAGAQRGAVPFIPGLQAARTSGELDSVPARQPEPVSLRLPGWLWSQCDPGGG